MTCSRALVVALAACDVNAHAIAIVYPATGDAVGDGAALATNLDTFIVVRVEGFARHAEPQNLEIVADNSSSLDIAVVGPVGFDYDGSVDPASEEREGTLVRLRPVVAGDNRLRFLTDQTDETETLLLSATAADGVRFDQAFRATPGPDARLATFLRSINVTPTFFRGSTDLTADGPLVLSSPVAETTLDGPPVATPWLHLAEARHTAVISVPGVSGTLAVTAATPDDIAVIGVRVGATELTGSTLTLALGERKELLFSPMTADGLTIDGNAPAIESSLAGSAATLTPGVGNSLYLDGAELGTSTLSLAWGAATLDIAITVN